jgi:hypothetical protein
MRKYSIKQRFASLGLSLLMVGSLLSVPASMNTDVVEEVSATTYEGDDGTSAAGGTGSGTALNGLFGYHVTLTADNTSAAYSKAVWRTVYTTKKIYQSSYGVTAINMVGNVGNSKSKLKSTVGKKNGVAALDLWKSDTTTKAGGKYNQGIYFTYGCKFRLGRLSDAQGVTDIKDNKNYSSLKIIGTAAAEGSGKSLYMGGSSTKVNGKNWVKNVFNKNKYFCGTLFGTNLENKGYYVKNSDGTYTKKTDETGGVLNVLNTTVGNKTLSFKKLLRFTKAGDYNSGKAMYSEDTHGVWANAWVYANGTSASTDGSAVKSKGGWSHAYSADQQLQRATCILTNALKAYRNSDDYKYRFFEDVVYVKYIDDVNNTDPQILEFPKMLFDKTTIAKLFTEMSTDETFQREANDNQSAATCTVHYQVKLSDLASTLSQKSSGTYTVASGDSKGSGSANWWKGGAISKDDSTYSNQKFTSETISSNAANFLYSLSTADPVLIRYIYFYLERKSVDDWNSNTQMSWKNFWNYCVNNLGFTYNSNLNAYTIVVESVMGVQKESGKTGALTGRDFITGNVTSATFNTYIAYKNFAVKSHMNGTIKASDSSATADTAFTESKLAGATKTLRYYGLDNSDNANKNKVQKRNGGFLLGQFYRIDRGATDITYADAFIKHYTSTLSVNNSYTTGVQTLNAVASTTVEISTEDAMDAFEEDGTVPVSKDSYIVISNKHKGAVASTLQAKLSDYKAITDTSTYTTKLSSYLQKPDDYIYLTETYKDTLNLGNEDESGVNTTAVTNYGDTDTNVTTHVNIGSSAVTGNFVAGQTYTFSIVDGKADTTAYLALMTDSASTDTVEKTDSTTPSGLEEYIRSNTLADVATNAKGDIAYANTNQTLRSLHLMNLDEVTEEAYTEENVTTTYVTTNSLYNWSDIHDDTNNVYKTSGGTQYSVYSSNNKSGNMEKLTINGQACYLKRVDATHSNWGVSWDTLWSDDIDSEYTADADDDNDGDTDDGDADDGDADDNGGTLDTTGVSAVYIDKQGNYCTEEGYVYVTKNGKITGELQVTETVETVTYDAESTEGVTPHISAGNTYLQKNPTIQCSYSSYYVQMSERAAGIEGAVKYLIDAESEGDMGYIVTNEEDGLFGNDCTHKMFSGTTLAGTSITNKAGSDGTYTEVTINSSTLAKSALAEATKDGSNVSGSMVSTYAVIVPRTASGPNVDSKQDGKKVLSKILNTLNTAEDGDEQNVQHAISGEEGATKLKNALNKAANRTDYQVKYLGTGTASTLMQSTILKNGFKIDVGTQSGTALGYDIMLISFKKVNLPIITAIHTNPDEVNMVYSSIAGDRSQEQYANYEYLGEKDTDKTSSGSIINDYKVDKELSAASLTVVTKKLEAGWHTAIGTGSSESTGRNKWWPAEENHDTSFIAGRKTYVFKNRFFDSITVSTNDSMGTSEKKALNSTYYFSNGTVAASSVTDAVLNDRQSKMSTVSIAYLGWNTAGVLNPFEVHETADFHYSMNANDKSVATVLSADATVNNNSGTNALKNGNLTLSRVSWLQTGVYTDFGDSGNSVRRYVIQSTPVSKSANVKFNDNTTLVTAYGIVVQKASSTYAGTAIIEPNIILAISRNDFTEADKSISVNAAGYGMYNQKAVKHGTADSNGTVAISAAMETYANVKATDTPYTNITNEDTDGTELVITEGSKDIYKWGELTEGASSVNNAVNQTVFAGEVSGSAYNQDLAFYMIKTKAYTYRTISHDNLLTTRNIDLSKSGLNEWRNSVVTNGSTKTYVTSTNSDSNVSLTFATPSSKLIMYYPEVKRTAYYANDTDGNGISANEVVKYDMNTVGESARTVRPVSLRIVNLEVSDSNTAAITTSDTVAGGTSAITAAESTTGTKSTSQQVIYPGGNINLNVTLKDTYVEMAGYALELPDNNSKVLVGDNQIVTGKDLTGQSTDAEQLYKDFGAEYKSKNLDKFASEDADYSGSIFSNADDTNTKIYAQKGVAKSDFTAWTETINQAITPDFVLNLSDTSGVKQAYANFKSGKLARKFTIDNGTNYDTINGLIDQNYTNTGDAAADGTTAFMTKVKNNEEFKTYKNTSGVAGMSATSISGLNDTTADSDYYNSYLFVVRNGMIILQEDNHVYGAYTKTGTDGKKYIYVDRTNDLGTSNYPVATPYKQLLLDLAYDMGYKIGDDDGTLTLSTVITTNGVSQTIRDIVETAFWKSEIGTEMLNSLVSINSAEDHSVTKTTVDYHWEAINSNANKVVAQSSRWYDEGTSVFVIKRYARRLDLTGIVAEDKLDINAGPAASSTDSTTSYTAKWYLKMFLDDSVYADSDVLGDSTADNKSAYLIGDATTTQPNGTDSTGVGVYLGEDADFLVPSSTTSDMRR